jgi:hypothetical protein
MNIHKNAGLTPIGRERLVQQVESGRCENASNHDPPVKVTQLIDFV